MNNLFKFRMKAFALIALLLVGVSNAFAQQINTIAIVNAGSSGSRLYVYEVNKDEKSVNTIYEKTFPMTLSKIKNIEDGVASYIRNIPRSSSLDSARPIDLYILATAGMRTLSENTAKSICSKLKGPTLDNKYNIKEAMTISGRYEGLYAWIAANYETLKTAATATSENTKGILEIGGQSMQIAFIPTPGTTPGTMDVIPHEKYGSIYSKSYVKGGANAIRGHYKDSLMVDSEVKPIDIYQKDVQGLSSVSDITFYGLGGTINGANKYKNATNFVEKVDLIGSIEPDYYYNTHYLRWVLEQLGLLANDKIDAKNADWTLGAAYDIVVNDNAGSIEEFNYDTNNPN